MPIKTEFVFVPSHNPNEFISSLNDELLKSIENGEKALWLYRVIDSGAVFLAESGSLDDKPSESDSWAFGKLNSFLLGAEVDFFGRMHPDDARAILEGREQPVTIGANGED